MPRSYGRRTLRPLKWSNQNLGEEGLLEPEVLADIGLVEYDVRGGVEVLAGICGLREHAEAERRVLQVVDDDAGVHGRAVGDATETGLIYLGFGDGLNEGDPLKKGEKREEVEGGGERDSPW